MLQRLLNLIIGALKKLSNSNLENNIEDIDNILISDKMCRALQLWKDLYEDKCPWADDTITSMGLPKYICQYLQMMLINELEIEIPEQFEQLNLSIDNHLRPHLAGNLEKALAFGGMIIKPYYSNDKIYFDFIQQGDFYPLSFDDDGKITDIVFLDQFVSKGKVYSRVERHIFNELESNVTITNGVFVADVSKVEDEFTLDLGTQIPLSDIPKWGDLEEEIVINDIKNPLYGYYKTANSNNVDLKSPLGCSVYNSVINLLKLADTQFSRLDWEYEGGQIAIDVDSTALCTNDTYYGQRLDTGRDRIYRKLDLGNENTYYAFTPALRDSAYINGLNVYLHKIEDGCGLARGTLGDVQSDARTATEIKILKQNTYTTVARNQELLDTALKDAFYAASVYSSLYGGQPVIDKDDINLNWGDSILTDIDTELAQKRLLVQDGILSKAELRSWYTGESIEIAQEKIQEMQEESIRMSQEVMMGTAGAGGLENFYNNDSNLENDSNDSESEDDENLDETKKEKKQAKKDESEEK